MAIEEKLEFVPLKKLLIKENETSEEIQTIFKREDEYIEFLHPIENFLAQSYLQNKKMKDIDVKKALRNIKLNYDKDISFFQNEIEKGIMNTTSSALQIACKKITKHELFLVFSYIIWCTKNRKHLGDSRAYLKWLCNFLNLYDKDEKKQFDEEYDEYRKEFSWSDEKLKILKGENSNDIPPVSEEVVAALESKKEAEDFEKNDGK